MRITDTDCHSYRNKDHAKVLASQDLPRDEEGLHPNGLFCWWNCRERGQSGREAPGIIFSEQVEKEVLGYGVLCESKDGSRGGEGQQPSDPRD